MKYKALVSSDWNQCLAPSGPFDPITFIYPDLEPDLSKIFTEYTGNEISLTQATQRISALIPAPITVDQMDAYLDANFATYCGVPDFIQWCRDHGILFMINTTGPQGSFQRMIARNLIPDVPFVASNPLICFSGESGDTRYMYWVNEIEDKPKNTQSVMRSSGVAPDRVVVIGDSGGDGPHFGWGGSVGAYLIGSMTKPSLEAYCSERAITINKHFGHTYSAGEARDRAKEMQTDFMELTETLSEVLDL
ncbi:MAG: hypothetical protein WBG50_17430 [Desulfomonilaceae bacterium]